MRKWVKILIGALIIYFGFGTILSAQYLIDEYKTFECPQSDGSVVTMFTESKDLPENCSRRVNSPRTKLGVVFLVFVGPPLFIMKTINNF